MYIYHAVYAEQIIFPVLKKKTVFPWMLFFWWIINKHNLIYADGKELWHTDTFFQKTSPDI